MFVRALGDLGYLEDRDFVILSRWAEGRLDRLPALVADLLAHRPDLIYAPSGIAAQAVKDSGTALPIVFAFAPDPVEQGFGTSLSRPGRNLTGLTSTHTELSAKRIELLKEAFPAIRLAAELRIPAVYNVAEYVRAGGLMCYGASYRDLSRRAAGYAVKILNGAAPGELPIERPTKLELVINMKTARALALVIPPSVLLRADEIIA